MKRSDFLKLGGFLGTGMLSGLGMSQFNPLHSSEQETSLQIGHMFQEA